MKKLLILLGLSSQALWAQDVRDLVRFSQTQVFGSARFESMGGSFGALGSDLSSSSINPAGYGRYSSSSFGMSFANTITKNNAIFNQIPTERNLNAFKLNNLGVVFTDDVSQRNRGFIFRQIGFSYNRVENFKDNFSYNGQQFYSLLDNFASSAAGLTPDDMYNNLPFTSALAWDTYAIDPDGSGGYFARLDPAYNVNHRRDVSSRGGISEYNFNYSANYMNKLYIGANIGLRTGKYQEDYYHAEQALNSDLYELDSFQYEYHLKTKGSGSNFKLGLIYLPKESIRLGLALHSPTFFEFKDDYSADMTSFHKDTTYRILEEYKPVGEYKYRLRTPARLVGSVAFIFGTRGCINIDAEVVNYKWAHFKSTTDSNYAPYDYKGVNKEAREQMRTTINLRIGGELVFNSQYFIRGGFALYPSAYDPKVNTVKATQIYSGGFGFRWKKNTLDLSLKFDNRNYNYYAFPESNTNVKALRTSICVNYAINF